MLNAMNILRTYYIKKIYFPGDDNSVMELISVTKETVEHVNGIQVVTPEILSSCIRKFNSDNIEQDYSEMKVFISKDQAQQLSELVEDLESYINLAVSLFNTCNL